MRRNLLGATAAVALAFAAVPSANAALMLQLSDGTTTQSATGAGGAVTYFGAIGNFVFDVTTGLSKPLAGSATLPLLDLNSVDVTASAGGTLTIKVTDTDFIGSGGILQFLNTVGGTMNAGSLNFNTYMDCSNAAFGTATQLTSQAFNTGAFSGGQNTFVSGCSGNYSLTEIATLQLPGAALISFDGSVGVPEPATLALFGSSLLVVGAALRRRKGRKSTG